MRNGSIFVVMWTESQRYGDSYAVWRGSRDSPFQRLRGAGIHSGMPCVSPDGRRLAYLGQKETHIVVRRIDPSSDALGAAEVIASLPLKRGSARADCAWSPRGSSLAFVGYGAAERRDIAGVWRVKSDGTGLRQVVEIPGRIARWPGDPAWSKIGRIAFNNGNPDRAWMVMMNADGSDLRRLPYRGKSPAWSPDGERFAFVDSAGTDYENLMGGPVMVADADGADPRRLRRGEHAGVSYSPDGSSLAFARWGADRVDITRTDGTLIERLPGPSSWWLTVGISWATTR